MSQDPDANNIKITYQTQCHRQSCNPWQFLRNRTYCKIIPASIAPCFFFVLMVF